MPYKITLITEDKNEYELEKTYKTEKAALKALNEIMPEGEDPGYFDDSPIDCGVVEKI